MYFPQNQYGQNSKRGIEQIYPGEFINQTEKIIKIQKKEDFNQGGPGQNLGNFGGFSGPSQAGAYHQKYIGQMGSQLQQAPGGILHTSGTLGGLGGLAVSASQQQQQQQNQQHHQVQNQAQTQQQQQGPSSQNPLLQNASTLHQQNLSQLHSNNSLLHNNVIQQIGQHPQSYSQPNRGYNIQAFNHAASQGNYMGGQQPKAFIQEIGVNNNNNNNNSNNNNNPSGNNVVQSIAGQGLNNNNNNSNVNQMAPNQMSVAGYYNTAALVNNLNPPNNGGNHNAQNSMQIGSNNAQAGALKNGMIGGGNAVGGVVGSLSQMDNFGMKKTTFIIFIFYSINSFFLFIQGNILSGLNNIYNLGDSNYQTNIINQLGTSNNPEVNLNNYGLRNNGSGEEFQKNYDGQS